MAGKGAAFRLAVRWLPLSRRPRPRNQPTVSGPYGLVAVGRPSVGRRSVRADKNGTLVSAISPFGTELTRLPWSRQKHCGRSRRTWGPVRRSVYAVNATRLRPPEWLAVSHRGVYAVNARRCGPVSNFFPECPLALRWHGCVVPAPCLGPDWPQQGASLRDSCCPQRRWLARFVLEEAPSRPRLASNSEAFFLPACL
jgi:hypothetical protein